MENERFSRIIRLIGTTGLRRLNQAQVAVIGLGAVGSFAVEALARAGVGRLRLVDFDVIRTSNINRQLYALESTLGQAKVDVAARRVKEINPACQVEGLRCFVHADTMDPALAGPPNLVIDAIDSFGPKVELLSTLVMRQIPVVSCMGAARRIDPLSVRMGSLTAVSGCPLASRLRKGLHRRGVSTDLLCVYSVEPVQRSVNNEPENTTEQEVEYLERGRPRHPLGSLPTLTGIFGLTVAHAALGILLKGQWIPASTRAGS